MRFVVLMGLALPALGGCEKPPTLPPEFQEPEKPVIDTVHTATLSGGERVYLENVTLEIDPAEDMVTLRAGGAESDAALYLMGTIRTTTTNGAGRSKQRAAREYEVIGPGRTWMEGSAGLRTLLWRYQPEMVVIRVESGNDTDARGKIEGTFFRFSRDEPLGRPATAEMLKGSFVARVVH